MKKNTDIITKHTTVHDWYLICSRTQLPKLVLLYAIHFFLGMSDRFTEDHILLMTFKFLIQEECKVESCTLQD